MRAESHHLYAEPTHGQQPAARVPAADHAPPRLRAALRARQGLSPAAEAALARLRAATQLEAAVAQQRAATQLSPRGGRRAPLTEHERLIARNVRRAIGAERERVVLHARELDAERARRVLRLDNRAWWALAAVCAAAWLAVGWALFSPTALTMILRFAASGLLIPNWADPAAAAPALSVYAMLGALYLYALLGALAFDILDRARAAANGRPQK